MYMGIPEKHEMDYSFQDTHLHFFLLNLCLNLLQAEEQVDKVIEGES